jgi:hypothetical protein
MELQEKILNTLVRFESIEYSGLKTDVLSGGGYCFAADRNFDVALLKLREAGKVQCGFGMYDRWWIVRPAATVGPAAPSPTTPTPQTAPRAKKRFK